MRQSLCHHQSASNSVAQIVAAAAGVIDHILAAGTQNAAFKGKELRPESRQVQNLCLPRTQRGNEIQVQGAAIILRVNQCDAVAGKRIDDPRLTVAVAVNVGDAVALQQRSELGDNTLGIAAMDFTSTCQDRSAIFVPAGNGNGMSVPHPA